MDICLIRSLLAYYHCSGVALLSASSKISSTSENVYLLINSYDKVTRGIVVIVILAVESSEMIRYVDGSTNQKNHLWDFKDGESREYVALPCISF